jgi:hypothetical protein
MAAFGQHDFPAYLSIDPDILVGIDTGMAQ